SIFYFFFFQAEDGIRDFHVTGVQTCALPIFRPVVAIASAAVTASALPNTILISFPRSLSLAGASVRPAAPSLHRFQLLQQKRPRSEERRVGKEWKTGWAR